MTTTNNTINKTNASLINHDISADLWDCMDDAAPVKKNRLIDRILEHGIEVDTLVTFEGRQVLKTNTGKVYIYNAEKGRASQYEADGTGYTPITVERFNAQVKAAEARIQRDVETSKRVRENTQRYEAAVSNDHNAVLLDAEREDSKFDYRRSEEIFLRSEAESYEDKGGFFDEIEDVIGIGHHVAAFIGYEEVRGKAYTGRDGQRYETTPYLSMEFQVGNLTFKTRAYTKHFNSFKIQANQQYNGIFTYTPVRKALEELKGQVFDIWVSYNDMIRELQAEFYDVEAYKARKAEEAQAGFVRSGYGRPTERKATR